jgi:hypothetical protein
MLLGRLGWGYVSSASTAQSTWVLMDPPPGYIPGVHIPETLIPVQDYDRRVVEASAQRKPRPVRTTLARQEVVEREIRRLGGIGRPTATTDLEEITRLLEAGAYTRRDPSFATAFELRWRAAVDTTWRRLSEASTFGSPTHDIVAVRCHWPAHGKPQRLTFEELSRQPSWLVTDAAPYVLREGLDIIKESRGRMDVWIAANGLTFRREELFRADHGLSRTDHDAKLTYYWKNDTRQRPVDVAVPVGDSPRTEETRRRFLIPAETKALRDTVLLTERGSLRSHTLDHDLGTALAAAIRASRPR